MTVAEDQKRLVIVGARAWSVATRFAKRSITPPSAMRPRSAEVDPARLDSDAVVVV
jgi:hypothetical protein